MQIEVRERGGGGAGAGGGGLERVFVRLLPTIFESLMNEHSALIIHHPITSFSITMSEHAQQDPRSRGRGINYD